jgi:hypothetical protein
VIGPGVMCISSPRDPGERSVLWAARHNKREHDCGSFNRASSNQNECLVGPASAGDVFDLWMRRVEAARAPRRSNGVCVVEVVFSLPCGFIGDDRAFFRSCVAWTEREFGGTDNILTADIHRDQPTVHMHVLIVPLIEGRLRGADMKGCRTTMRRRQESFRREVAQPFGLNQPRQLTRKDRVSAAALVVARLREMQDPVTRSMIWDQVRVAIELEPGAYLAALGLEAPKPRAKRLKSSTAIFISPGKGPRREAVANA